MFNSNIPSKDELPSTSKLVKSTILASMVAAVILVTVVLPAEYAIDPTGLGKIIGLQKMGEIKMSLAKEVAEEEKKSKKQSKSENNSASNEKPKPKPAVNMQNKHVKTITLAPNQAREIKLKMSKGKKVSYQWHTNVGWVNYNVHGDSKPLKIKYHYYGKGSRNKKNGIIVAAFDGYHGWWWRNRTRRLITLTLKTKGEYLDIVQVK